MLKNDYFKVVLGCVKPIISVLSLPKNSQLSSAFIFDARKIEAVFFFLKNSSLTRFNSLIEYTAIDSPEKNNRFSLLFFLASIEYNYKFMLSCEVPVSFSFNSLNFIYPNSSWSEREIRDMFGVFFTNNTDMRRLLTDYGFSGFPLRKDFPLTGYIEVRYDDDCQSVLYEPVQLTQEFRLFTVSSPWEKKN